MRNQRTKEFIKIITKKYRLSIEEVKEIVSSPFEFSSYIMENVSDRDKLYFPSIRIPNFGIFYTPDYVKERLRQINKDESNESNTS